MGAKDDPGDEKKSLGDNAATATMTSKKNQSKIAEAFFKGEIKDKTTKDSRKAAESLHALKTIKKNPTWVPADNKTKMLKQSSKQGLPPAELAKMRAQIGDTVPQDVVASTTKEIAEGDSLPNLAGNLSFKNPML